jgi:hypothetical protein
MVDFSGAVLSQDLTSLSPFLVDNGYEPRREEDFGVGDYVMVTTKSWNLRRPTRKLAEQSVGPFRITERREHLPSRPAGGHQSPPDICIREAAQSFQDRAIERSNCGSPKYPNLPGPPKRLEEWLRAAEEDMFLEDHAF